MSVVALYKYFTGKLFHIKPHMKEILTFLLLEFMYIFCGINTALRLKVSMGKCVKGKCMPLTTKGHTAYIHRKEPLLGTTLICDCVFRHKDQYLGDCLQSPVK